MDPDFGGRTKGIPWMWADVMEQRIRVPHGCSQFAVLHNIEHERVQAPHFIVVRIHTLEAVPASESYDWPGAHTQLGPALAEARAREEIFRAFAIQMLGQNALPAPTLFTRKAYENRRRG